MNNDNDTKKDGTMDKGSDTSKNNDNSKSDSQKGA